MFFRSFLFLSLLTFTLSKKSFSSSKRGGGEEEGSILTSDLPYIACEVCEHFVQAVVEELKELRKHAIKNTIEEYTVSEVIDSACQPTNQTGQWIRELDIITTTQGDGQSYLHLDQPGGVSKCHHECKTITRSCQDLLDHDLEVDDLSAYLWKRKTYSMKEVTKKVCKEMSTRCKKRKALPTNYHRIDYPFEAISEKDLEMEKLMASMQSMGLGGSMYNRDDMMNMAGMMGGGGFGGEEDGYDGEDDMMNFGMGGGGLGGAGHGQYGEDEEDEQGWEV